MGKKLVLALEFGGQSVKAASIDSKGNLGNVFSFKLNQKNPLSFDEFKNKLEKIIQKSKSKRKISAVSIAAPRPHYSSSLKFNLEQKPAYKNVNGKSLKKLILKSADCEVFYTENDAAAAAKGEIWKGAILSKGKFMFLTLGTGLGGSFVIDSKIVKGKNVGATNSGEIWDYQFKGENIEENVGTTKAIVKIYSNLGGKEKKIINGNIKYLAKMARNKNQIAVDTFRAFGVLLGKGIAELAVKFKPKSIILSGGVSNEYDLFGKEANRALLKKLENFGINKKIVFKKSKLIDKGGLIGAGYVALSKK